MRRMKSLWTLVLAAVLSGVASPSSADPVRVTGGFIQVGAVLADLSISTEAGVRYAGERESTMPSTVILSGLPGDVVNLSFSYADVATSFGTLDPTTPTFARLEFEFTGGDAIVPTATEALASGAPASAAFTFTGSFIFFASMADALANVNATGRQDLFGSGTATALFRVDRTNVGIPLPGAPLLSNSIVYRFEDEAPVPEPATLLLLSGGLGVLLSRRKMRE